MNHSLQSVFFQMFVLTGILLLAGCSAISAKSEAQSIVILNENQVPDIDRCQFVGEVSGSQGNWFTGTYTSDENLLVGARNDLRNEAYELGGNMVHIQHVSSSGRYEASGNANTTIIGNVYNCR